MSVGNKRKTLIDTVVTLADEKISYTLITFISEEERKKSIKVSFGLKSKAKPTPAKPAAVAVTKNVVPSVFNQTGDDDDDDEEEEAPDGFVPRKDPAAAEVKKLLQKQIQEKEELLKKLTAQAQAQIQAKKREIQGVAGGRGKVAEQALKALNPTDKEKVLQKVQAEEQKKQGI